MVRETRHLWVGNLPENIREDRIRDHFKRYGRVQSVKLLPRSKDDEGTGICATVSFMDIKSASKAHNNEQKLEDRALSTEYHEPAAIPGGSAAPIYASPRFSHGVYDDVYRPPEEISSFERSSHFYERERERRDGDAYLRRPASTYHVAPSEPLRGRARDRLYRNGPYTPIIESVVSRQPSHHRSVGSSWSYESPASRYPPASTTPDVVYPEERREPTPVVVLHKKHSKSRSGSNGSESGSNSGSSGSRSRSSSSSSQSGSSSCSSASSSPGSDKSCSTHSHHGSLRSGVTLQSAVSTPHTNNSSPAVHSEDRRPLAICVRNLPARSSDTSLKDGLFHEYKKHGKVTWVKVVGQGADRYALVCFKKPDDVEKALQVSHDKLFFGCKIEVAPYQGYDVDDNEFRPYEAEQDEFHPKATRTLFIGNLEKDITAPELRKHFDQFGEIIEIDIKKQGNNSSYAFCQYCDISSVVRAMRTLDGEHLGNNRIKLGFGKSMHTNCVWVDGVADSVSEKYLSLQFSQFGLVSHVAIDRSRGHALVFYEQISFAQMAVKEMRGVALRGRKLQVDFASRECQEAFYDHLEKQSGHSTTFENSIQASPQGMISGGSGTAVRGFETPSSSSSSSGGGGGGTGAAARYPSTSIRYPPQQQAPRSTPLYPRAPSNSGASPGASTPSPSTPARTTPRHQPNLRFDFTADYSSERRPYRSYEDVGVEDGSGLASVVVGPGPPDIRHLQKERVALLEQLEDCVSSGEEGGPRRRCKHRRSHSGEGGGGSSRPGTPLCDERPENLPPVEPRRTPRERPPDPLSLPLPRFASQVLSPLPAPPSPPASPPRPHSSSSDDSEPSPPSPEWEERLRSLDEKYEKWSGSRTGLAKLDSSSLRIRHKLLDLDLHELQPSDIVKSVLAKRSVFDEDSKRLENFGEKYEPREFIPKRPGFAALRSRLDSSSPLNSPAPKSPASSPAGAKGLQYPFPSHPPVQPTTSVATTTAAITLVSCAGVGSIVSTSGTSTVPSTEVSKVPPTFPTTCISSTVASVRQFPTPVSNYPPPKISPPPPASVDKKLECSETSPHVATNSSDKSRSLQKTPVTGCIKLEKCDAVKKEVTSSVSVSCKQVKPCLRRESGDERKDGDSRRKSREESVMDVKQTLEYKESDSEKTKDTESCERRRSITDKRRESVDCSRDLNRKDHENICDRSKDNHKEERRRDSVDASARRDGESDLCKLRLIELKRDCSNEHLEISSECSRLADSDSVNIKTSDRRKDSDENTRHTLSTDSVDSKMKDVFGVCSERDRRRGRESVDSCSDNSRHRKVPESLERKREESDPRHRDNTSDKKEEESKRIQDYQERKKDSGHNENIRNNEISDRRKEKDISDANQENNRHKEKKESTRKDKESVEHNENIKHKSNMRKSPETHENTRHKDVDRKRSLSSDVKHRDSSAVRKNSESCDDYSQKSELKKEHDFHYNSRHKSFDRSKESESSETLVQHSHNRKESVDLTESLHHRDSVIRKDSESMLNSRHRDVEKKKDSLHHENARNKDTEKRKESDVTDVFRNKELDVKKDHGDLSEASIKIERSKKESDLSDFLRQKELDKARDSEGIEPVRVKENDRRRDSESSEVKHKDMDRKKEHEITDNVKRREGEKRKDSENIDVRHLEIERRKELESGENIKHREHKNSELRKEVESSETSKHSREFDKRKDQETSDICRRDADKKKDMENAENIKNREDRRRDFEQPDNMRHNDHKKGGETPENSKYVDRKKDAQTPDIFRRREVERKKDGEAIEISKYRDYDRRKEDIQDTSKHRESSEKRKESRKERESVDNDGVRVKDNFEERRKDREGDREKVDKQRKSKDFDNQERLKDSENQDKRKECNSDNTDKKQLDSSDKVKEANTGDENERKTESIKKEKRKDRVSSSSWPASIGCKRRLSSQDSVDSCTEDAKRLKPERRDSKDSGRSSSSSKKSNGEKHNKCFTKLLEEKIKEDREKELHKKKKDVLEEKELNTEEKTVKPGVRKEKRNSGERRKEDKKSKPRPKENGNTGSESEAGSGDEENKSSKRHSIFDIVDDEPAYISMYDKVKARSTKNMQKQEEEKRQERLKEKFSQLKQCRAKREEKKRSTSYDEDSDSERGGPRRSAKLMITSSEEDAGSEGDMRTKGRKIVSDTSEDDNRHNAARVKPIRIHSEEIEPKPRKIMSDTSEDDTLRLSISRIKASRLHSEDLEPKVRKILSDTSEDDILRHSILRNKSSRIQSDESEADTGFEEQVKNEDDRIKCKRVIKNSVSVDVFSNVSEDHFAETEAEQDHHLHSPESFRRNSVDSNAAVSEVPRKKSHKKKQKRQKNCEDSEDGLTGKRHSSKKDRRKSHNEEDSKIQGKVRKKKSDRENAVKRDEKMEDIFGPLSDDSDKVLGKWQVSQVYGSDSESEKEVRKRDKKKKERKTRELVEAGRTLEAKVRELGEAARALEAKLIDSDTFTQSEEPAKTKKKKRKKSREEKSSKHHQQRLDEEAAVTLAIEADSEREPDLPPVQPPSPLPTLPLPLSQSLPRLIDSPPHPPSHIKKPDIPGFGSQVDENIHETAVKSISESPTKIIEEPPKPIESISQNAAEDKPTPVISQEETEDAVAALLMEDSFGGGFEGYPTEEATKPDTPISEPDLQIDTDTEDTFDPIDFSRPPRTPDIQPSYYRQDTREGLEERILALACPESSALKEDIQKPVSQPVVNHNSQDEHVEQEYPLESSAKQPSSIRSQEEPSEEKPVSLNAASSCVAHEIKHGEAGKRHDLPPVVRQTELSHVIQPMKHSLPDSQHSKPSQIHPEIKLVQLTAKQIVRDNQTNLKPMATNTASKPVPSNALSPPPLSQVVQSISSPYNDISQKASPVTSMATHSQTNVRPTTQTSQASIVQSALIVQQPVYQTSQIIQQTKSSVQQLVTSVAPVTLQQTKVITSQQKSIPSINIQPPGPERTVPVSVQQHLSITVPLLQPTNTAQQQQPSPKLKPSPPLVQQQKVVQFVQQQGPVVQEQTVSQQQPSQQSEQSSIQQQQIFIQKTSNVQQQQQQTIIKQQQSVVQQQNVQPVPNFQQPKISSAGQPQQAANVKPVQQAVSAGTFSQQQKVNVPVQQSNVQQQSALYTTKPSVPVIPPNCTTTMTSPGLKTVLPARQQIVNSGVPVVHNLNTVQSTSAPSVVTSVAPTASRPNIPIPQSSSASVVQTTVSQSQTLAQQKPLLSPVIQQPVNAVSKEVPASLPQQVIQQPLKTDVLQVDATKSEDEKKHQALPQVIKCDVFNSPPLKQIVSNVLKPWKQSIQDNSTVDEQPLSLTQVGKEVSDNHQSSENPVCFENHIDAVKNVQIEEKEVKPVIEDTKPLNAVIQDLTYKAAKAKLAMAGKTENDTKSDVTKPIEQVVQQIHERIKAASCETKDFEKLDIKVESNITADEVTDFSVAKPYNDIKIKSEKVDNVEEQENGSKPVEERKDDIKIGEKPDNDSKSKKNNETEVKHTAAEFEKMPKTLFEERLKEDTKCNAVIEETPRVEKIRIKKEEKGLFIDPVVTPLTPKVEKSSIFVSPGESNFEPKDLETANVTKQPQHVTENIKQEKAVKEETVITPVRGGRGGRRRKASGRIGGVVTRRARLNNNTTTTNAGTPSADVYEFRDDSEEETGRPRLILTIKSPSEPRIIESQQPPPQPAISASTRKSRRLQERDGSRTTVDDTIEDVIRGTRSGNRRNTRASALSVIPTPPVIETRKSPRRKQAASKETVKEQQPQATSQPPPQQQQPASLPATTVPPAQETAPPPQEVKTPVPEVKQDLQEPSPAPKLPSPQPSKLTSPAVVTEPTTLIDPVTGLLPSVVKEPMTLIDPVTGLLIPMRESEEGQYIPVSTDHIRSLSESREETGEPVEKRRRTSVPSETMQTSPSIVVSAPFPPCSSALPVRPAIQPKVSSSNINTVPPFTPKINLSSNVGKPSSLVGATPAELIRPVIPQPAALTRPSGGSPIVTNVSKPVVVTSNAPRPSTTIVTPIALTKPLTVCATPLVKPSAGVMMSPTGMSKTPVSASVPSPVVLNRVVVPPSVSPVVSQPLLSTSTATTTVTTASATTTFATTTCLATTAGTTITPINHKAHLLQAVVSHRGKVPVAKIPTPLTPKAHILQSIGNVSNVNCGAREGVVGPGTPPPPHHGALLTGSVASPPLRAAHHGSQQPIVTGASSSRVVCKGIMEPLKIESGATATAGGGCIVVPTPSPQPRGQVMQAGLPVPAYEASLGEVVQHVNYPPHHIQPAHYVHSQLMYQQYLREAALGGYHLPPGSVKPTVDIEEGARGAGASPPLELRRGSPHDRTTDSPQVATLYVHGPPRHLHYYEGPPPAHRPSQPRLQVATPPHASQVPPQADSLLMLLQRYPVMWQGLLALKTDQAAVQMHFVFGNPHVARDSLPCNSDGSTPPLRIAQRMRLEQTQLDGVARKMQMDNEHCMLLALPCGRDHMDVLQQSNNLQSGFITYLQQKQAAGIVNIAAPGSQQAAYVVHIFPACDFANESLARIAPDLLHRVADIAHLLIVIATV